MINNVCTKDEKNVVFLSKTEQGKSSQKGYAIIHFLYKGISDMLSHRG